MSERGGTQGMDGVKDKCGEIKIKPAQPEKGENFIQIFMGVIRGGVVIKPR